MEGGKRSRTPARSRRSGWRRSTRKRWPRQRTSSSGSMQAGRPFFCWWNGTRMHFRTHVKKEHKGLQARTATSISDGMVEHDMHVGQLLKLLDDLGIANNTIVFYSTDNGPHYNTWPDAGTTMFRSEKNSNWEGAYRVPAFVRWPGQFPANDDAQRHRHHEDWLPTFAAAGGDADIKVKLRQRRGAERPPVSQLHRRPQHARLLHRQGEGIAAQGVHLRQRRRSGGGDAIGCLEGRYSSRTEGRRSAFGASRSPNFGCRCCLTCAAIRSNAPSTTANTYNDWFLDRAFVLVPLQQMAGQVPHDNEGVSAKPVTRLIQSGEDPETDRGCSTRLITLPMRGCACPDCRRSPGWLGHAAQAQKNICCWHECEVPEHDADVRCKSGTNSTRTFLAPPLMTHSSPGRCAPIAARQWPERRILDHLILWSRHRG